MELDRGGRVKIDRQCWPTGPSYFSSFFDATVPIRLSDPRIECLGWAFGRL